MGIMGWGDQPGADFESPCDRPDAAEPTALVPTTGERINDAMQQIIEDIPERLGISEIVADAHRRLLDAAAGGSANPALEQIIGDKLIEVLREIASYAVQQFEGRTGQRFMWVDDDADAEDGGIFGPEPKPEPQAPQGGPQFRVDEKGHVVFG
jgi:hypothetical protein